ncbi:hypothetical protein KAZ82_02450, partial [Candidatus Babeliales bacterium]|nr:hypothetical protein [Candidatus Babeliales bacterium]
VITTQIYAVESLQFWKPSLADRINTAIKDQNLSILIKFKLEKAQEELTNPLESDTKKMMVDHLISAQNYKNALKMLKNEQANIPLKAKLLPTEEEQKEQLAIKAALKAFPLLQEFHEIMKQKYKTVLFAPKEHANGPEDWEEIEPKKIEIDDEWDKIEPKEIEAIEQPKTFDTTDEAA